MFIGLRSDSIALSHVWLGLHGGRFQVRSKSVIVSYTLRAWPNTLLKDEESARDNHVLVEGEGMEGMGRKGLEIGRGGKDVKGRTYWATDECFAELFRGPAMPQLIHGSLVTLKYPAHRSVQPFHRLTYGVVHILCNVKIVFLDHPPPYISLTHPQYYITN